MILDTTSMKLEAVLAGAVAANAPEFHVIYQDYNQRGELTKPAISRGQLDGANDVEILAAPDVQSTAREVLRASIYNEDTASVTVTVKTDDGTTERIVIKATLLTLEALMFEKGHGWYVVTASGGFKEGGISGPATSTDNAVARWDGASGTAIQNSGVIVSDANAVSGVASLTFSSTSGIIGSTTNDSAAALSVGEYVSSSVVQGSAVALTTGTAANITSISLTAGDWDVCGTVVYDVGGPITSFEGGWGTTSATVPTRGDGRGWLDNEPAASGENRCFSSIVTRLSLNGTTTTYLVAQATFGSGSCAAYGTIAARRAR